jgi:hypothetical protein
MDAARKHYQLVAECRGPSLAVRVNDIAVHEDEAGAKGDAQVPLNQWLSSGRNTLLVRAGLVPGAAAPTDASTVTVSVVEALVDGGAATETTLATVAVPSPDTLPQFPLEVTREFELEIPYGDWAWLAGDPFDEDNLPLDEFQAFAERARTVLDSRDMAGTQDLLAVRNRELAQAYYLDPAQRLADSEAFFKELFAAEGWQVEPPDYERMLVRLHADNRLAELTGPKGKPLLQTPTLNSDFTFGLPLFVARVKGALVLCR